MPKINWQSVAKSTLICLLIALIPMFLIAVVPIFAGQYPDTNTLLLGGAASLLFGVTIYFVSVFTRRLQKHVGTVTGFAALAGIAAIAGTALALALPTCPGSMVNQSCSTAEGATWGLSLGLLVVLFTIFWVIITGSIDFSKWAYGKAAEQVKKAKSNGEDSDEQEETPKKEGTKEKQDAR